MEEADRELEDEIVGGPSPDLQSPPVRAALMVPGAERRQVPRIVGSFVGAVDDVVAVEVPPRAARRRRALPAVALEDLPGCAREIHIAIA
jgi:hypothetical protein